jgi:flavin-dependent dehydrogenase
MHGMFSIGGSIYHSASANFAAQDSAEAKSSARKAQEKVRILEDNLAKSLMINEALWELMRDKLRLTEDDLNNKLYEIDMRDGSLDEKNQKPVSDCPQCHRKVSSRHAACIYCGTVIDDSVFRMNT